MTPNEMQSSLLTGFNKQGRRVSETMAVKYMLAINRAQANKFVTEQYHGFEVSGGNGHWYVSGWQTIYTSRAKAIAAVDACLELRAMLAES